MEKNLPVHAASNLATNTAFSGKQRKKWLHMHPLHAVCFALIVISLSNLVLGLLRGYLRTPVSVLPPRANEILEKCTALKIKPGPPPDFNNRTESDRFESGTKPTLIRDATIWTGRVKGLEVLKGDILLDKGLIKAVGHVHPSLLDGLKDLQTVDAAGAWVTPGIVDLHSHVAVEPSPGLNGASDGNSFKGPVIPWLRSIDGINTRDDSFQLSIAGGVTTSLILPGSANAIGGQAFVIKLRPTSERSPSGLLIEPPFGLNGSDVDLATLPRWRHIKHACGENPARVYSQTRMDTTWDFRQAYNKARQIMIAQDNYCQKAFTGSWNNLGDFPDDLQWEALVDVLRGKVKVQTHCYEAVDLDSFVRLSNEFKFPIAAFHHAHEAYLVPEVLKNAYDEPPAIAMFATFSRYKREAYRHSEFAPRILADSGIKVVMKSDHPGILSRYLMHEAQQAHYWGLPDNIALASVMTTPAEVMGLEHRIGFLKKGYDADLVIWDSHPLQLGATPIQTYIDGVPQLESSHARSKPDSQLVPKTPNFDKEAANTLKYEGLPPLTPSSAHAGCVIFVNVSSVWTRQTEGLAAVLESKTQSGIVAVEEGRIVCSGTDHNSCRAYSLDPSAVVVDLKGGSLSPALVSAASPLGLQEIAGESSTSDGATPDPLMGEEPPVFGKDGVLIKALDGLQFGTRDALLAYRAGVTQAVVAPATGGFLSGLSTSFSTGSGHKLQRGAIVQDVAALHVSIGHRGSIPSVSTQIATLRRLLLERIPGDLGSGFQRVSEGSLPLVIEVNNADIIATLLQLKQEIEKSTGIAMKMTLLGAAEAHLLSRQISEANVGVIVNPPRSHPYTWEQRRILPGPPLTHNSLISSLFAHNVTVGIGPQGVEGMIEMGGWASRNTRFDAAWAAIDSDGSITKTEALAMVSVNIEKLIGIHTNPADGDLVATGEGDLLSFEGKVMGIISPRRGAVDLF